MRVCLAVLLQCVLITACSSPDLYDGLPAEGALLPTFSLPLLSGDSTSPAHLEGAPAVVALWSTDCGYSRLALQGLEGIYNDYSSRGLRVLIVADDADAEHLRAFMDSARIDLPVAYASGRIHEIFDPERTFPWQHSFPLPSYLIVDRSGRVVRRAAGILMEEAEAARERAPRLTHLRNALEYAL